MRKYQFTPVLVVLLSLTGCQLANEAVVLKDKGGSGAFSCGQIRAAFSAYDADRQSVDSYVELAKVTGLSTADASPETVNSYYDSARERANLALVIQGCPPLE